jgi:hypothetical protein
MINAVEKAQERAVDIEAVLKEFVDCVNILSMRVGMTAKDVAEMINPVAEKARAVLEKK